MKPSIRILQIIFLVMLVSSPISAQLVDIELQGTSQINPYLIYSENDLRKVGNLADWSLDKCYKLMNDIFLDFSLEGAINWLPIGNQEAPFTGVFDGNGKMISGIVMKNSSKASCGFFGAIDAGEVKNLTLDNLYIDLSTSRNIGGLVGVNYNGKISNCYVSGDISVKDISCYIGGLVAFNMGGSIYNCGTYGKIDGGLMAGGLVAYNTGVVQKSFSKMDVRSHMTAGGLIATLDSSNNSFPVVTACYSTGDVTSGSYVGGLVGEAYSKSIIRNCYSLANIRGGASAIGGIVGDASETTIESCYFSGAIYRMTDRGTPFIGYIAGRSSLCNINNCFFVPADDRYNWEHRLKFISANWSIGGLHPIWEFKDSCALPILVGIGGQ